MGFQLNRGKIKTRSRRNRYWSVSCAAIRDIRSKIPDIELYQWSEQADTPLLEGAVDLNAEISNIDSGPLVVELDIGSPRDKLIYIYTSGTTGMPKAAVINNLRWAFAASLVGEYAMKYIWYLCTFSHRMQRGCASSLLNFRRSLCLWKHSFFFSTYISRRVISLIHRVTRNRY